MNNNSLIWCHEFTTPIGKLILGTYNDKLCLSAWANASTLPTIYSRLTKTLKTSITYREAPMTIKAIDYLNKYFDGILSSIDDIPLLDIGSEFMQTVWHTLCTIPAGTTISYRCLAERMGRPTSTRAVARAVALNPLMIFYPCHRVIGTNGKLTGYAGGIEIKRQLLAIESQKTVQ